MKTYSVLSVLYLCLTINSFSQVQFTSHPITTAADGALSVYAVDVDGDGDIDVLSASQNSGIAWYENDSDENFTSHAITTTAVARSVYAEDVDGDGDMDVLSADDVYIEWYENDGNENFTSHTITTAAGAWSVYAEDVDGDGDMDVLSASLNDDKIAWYENDGNENFLFFHTITTAADGARSVYAEDVDDDGDMDVLSASQLDNKIAWYENDGNENFAPHPITTAADGARSVYAEDVDGDGDMDVLSASFNDDKIAWYENDGNENFAPHPITTAADGAYSVYAEDIDGDGDMDVLSASFNDDKIAWYENDGNESFNPHTVTTAADAATSVYAVDVDSDGDMDVLSASGVDDKIAWYESLIFVANRAIDLTRISHSSGDHIEMGDVLDMGTQDFTIEAKISANSFPSISTSGAKIINKGLAGVGTPPSAGYGLRIWEDGGDNYVLFLIHDGVNSFSIEVNGLLPNVCYYVTGVREGTSMKLYLDGSLVADTTTSSALDLNTNLVFAIGALSRAPVGSVSEFFDGQIDEVRIWTVARSQQQIQNTLNDTLGVEYYSTSDSGLVAYYRLDVLEDLGIGGDGADDVRDLSPNNYHGDTFGSPGFVTNCLIVGIDEEGNTSPNKFEMLQNYPNPFNPTTIIRFQLPEPKHVRLDVFDISGREVRTLIDGRREIGLHEVQWDGRDEAGRQVSSGIYFYRLKAGDLMETKKMMILR